MWAADRENPLKAEQDRDKQRKRDLATESRLDASEEEPRNELEPVLKSKLNSVAGSSSVNDTFAAATIKKEMSEIRESDLSYGK